MKLTVRSEDIAHSFAIDEYRIVKRVPAGGSTTFEFRADRAGTFPFYCNLTSEPGHQDDARRARRPADSVYNRALPPSRRPNGPVQHRPPRRGWRETADEVEAARHRRAPHPGRTDLHIAEAGDRQRRSSPGERLKEIELAETLGASRTPVREALSWLERERPW